MASAPTHAFLGYSFTSIPHNMLSKSLAAFPRYHCQNNGQRWGRMNPVAMTVFNPCEEYWPSLGSNQKIEALMGKETGFNWLLLKNMVFTNDLIEKIKDCQFQTRSTC